MALYYMQIFDRLDENVTLEYSRVIGLYIIYYFLIQNDVGTNDDSVPIYEFILRCNSESKFFQSWASLDFSFGVIFWAAKKLPGGEGNQLLGSWLEPGYEKESIANMGSA